MRKTKLYKTMMAAVLAVAVNLSFATENWVYIGSQTSKKTEINLQQSSRGETVLTFYVNAYQLHSVKTPNGDAVTVSLMDGASLLQAGNPDVERLVKSVIVPDDANMQIEVLTSDFVEIPNVLLAPSKGNLSRDINPDDVAYTFGPAYSKDQFFPGTLANLEQAYVFRDFRGMPVAVNPVQYNPLTKILRIYSKIEVRVFESGKSNVNVLTAAGKPKVRVAEFNTIYDRHFINFATYNDRYTTISEEGKMLIITHDAFAGAMAPFVEWKTLKGMEVEMVNVSTIGTSSASIKTYVTNYYNNNGLTFLLLIGDSQQIPAMVKSGNDSDAAYGQIVGTDAYAELFVGRFSAENIAQVETQVQRVLTYEKTPVTSFDFYSKYVGIASSQGLNQGDDGEADYTHIHNQVLDLTGFTYTGGTELYEGNQGWTDAPGDPTAAMLGAAVNEGRGLITYCGHGSDNSFVTTGFSSTNVNALTNENKLPFIFSVACVNGNFVGQTCFAEAWLRATKNNNPTGAVAMFASTINQDWAPPMAAQDEMIDILTESYTNNIKRTFAGISINGCMLMNDEYTSDGPEMTDTWTIFGDPSMYIRTALPTEMTVSYSPAFFIGLSSFTLQCDTEGALVALTSNGQILGTALVSNGEATLTIEPFTDVATMNVTVTAFNKIPYLGTVEVLPNNSAWITMSSYTVADQNNNGMAEIGETVKFNVNLKNVGSQPANALQAVLTTTDPYVSLLNSEFTFGNMTAEQTAQFENIFEITIADSVPDQHQVVLNMQLTDALDSIWNISLKVTLNGPVLAMGNVLLSDSEGGNNNSRINPGEIVQLRIQVENNGHAATIPGNAILSTTNPKVEILDAEVSVDAMGVGSKNEVVFTVMVDPTISDGSAIEFAFEYSAGAYQLIEPVFQKVGTTVEDFETANFSSYAWQINNDPWTITNTAPFEGLYCAKSGQIGHEGRSVLQIALNVLVADDLTFYKKVSSEQGYDSLAFYIDFILIDAWTGEVPWSQESYSISAGLHTFSWKYRKDGSTVDGQDCAWVDKIKFPAHENPFSNPENVIVFASEPLTVARAEQEYSYEVVMEHMDPNSTDLNFVVSQFEGPEWLTVTPGENGHYILSGTPAREDMGEVRVVLSGTNSKLFNHQCFTIQVKAPVSVNTLVTDKLELAISPNPGKGVVEIRYSLPATSNVNLDVYDMIGKKVLSLEENVSKISGNHTAKLNTENLSNGIYFVTIKADSQLKTMKLIVR